MIEADALLPAVEHEITAAEQRGAERALREAADEWTHGAWADAPRRFDRIAERIANGQHVGDWLRDRAALTADPTMGGWLDTADPDRAPLDDRLADGKAGR